MKCFLISFVTKQSLVGAQLILRLVYIECNLV